MRDPLKVVSARRPLLGRHRAKQGEVHVHRRARAGREGEILHAPHPLDVLGLHPIPSCRSILPAQQYRHDKQPRHRHVHGQLDSLVLHPIFAPLSFSVPLCTDCTPPCTGSYHRIRSMQP